MRRSVDTAAADTLRVHHLLDASRANGPGLRAVVWVQGCGRDCPGCFNPETHDPAGGDELTHAGILAWWARVATGVDGLTVSGGEPLEQAASLSRVLEAARAAADLPVLLFTGWTWAEVQASTEAAACVDLVDAVVLGPYVREPAGGAGPWGSSSQELRLLSPRLAAADFDALPAAEVVVGADGSLVVTGTDPPDGLGEAHTTP